MMRNVSSKSIILAPFNSTKSNLSDFHDSFKKKMYEKNSVMKFAARVRDVDR